MDQQVRLSPMDRLRPTGLGPKARTGLYVSGAVGLVGGIFLVGSTLLDSVGYSVLASKIEVATVAKAQFRDHITARATAMPAKTIYLDVADGGRVEAKFKAQGNDVAEGDPIVRLGNPQRQLELLQRQTEVAQQQANLVQLRALFEANKTARELRLVAARAAVKQARIAYEQRMALVRQGMARTEYASSAATLLSQRDQELAILEKSTLAESLVEQSAIKQLDTTTARLEAGLQGAQTLLDALLVKAPIGGKLTNFEIEIGQSVPAGTRIGQIDSLDTFKLRAALDEFYLAKVKPGMNARVSLDDTRHARAYVVDVDPQVRSGQFNIELAFEEGQSLRLTNGQSVAVDLELAASVPSVVIPKGAFVADTGGAWIFVVSKDGRTADRRTITVQAQNQTQVAVSTGLSVGETVIVSSYESFAAQRRLNIEQDK